MTENTKLAGAQSIDRAFDILHLIAAASPQGIRLKDICSGTGLAQSTVHRILAKLQERGLIERIPGGARYIIGGELTLLGLSSGVRRFRELAGPTLRGLSDQVGDAVFLTVRSGLDTVCADRKIGSFPIQVLSIEIGSRRPLGISANSVAMLSRMPEAEVTNILEQNADRLSPFKTPRAVLQERIATARQRGYVHIAQAIVKGTSAIGMPVCDVVGRPIAAISTIAILSRQNKSRVPDLVSLLQKAAQTISELSHQEAIKAGSSEKPSLKV
ncbi:IclR family transcriptional regulator [uncultured Roseibium sp.]|uniref:IclR family transcriptional regulator n=1 Tax=uncultured Roseibium sp. TaxID=1936171 RepID=UPI003217FAA8